MRGNIYLLAGLALSATMAAAPASAALLTFDVTGSRTATFNLDSNAVPSRFTTSALVGDQIFFNSVAGTFGGVAGIADINFGSGLIASLNINGVSPTSFSGQFSGATLFGGTPANPVFNTGTFALSGPLFSQASLTIRNASVSSAVPESATWAMMLVGFGAVGAASRYRRRKTAVSFG